MQDVLKKVFKDGIKNFKEHWLSSYILTLIAIIFLCSGLAISLNPNFTTYSILFVLFISLPILFAIIVSIYGNRKNIDSLRWRNIFRYSLSYFKAPFRGAFRIIGTGILVFFTLTIAETLLATLTSGIMVKIYPHFNEIIKQLYELMNSGDIASLNNFLVTYSSEINTFEYISLAPALIISLSVGILFSLYHLYYTYFLINFPLANMMITRICYRNAKIKARKTMLKGFFAFAWVFIFLLISGYSVTLVICYFSNISFHFANVFGLLIGVTLSMLYLPLFLSFNESLFIENISLYDPNQNNSSTLIADQLEEQIKQYTNIVEALEKEKQKIDNEIPKENQNEKDK